MRYLSRSLLLVVALFGVVVVAATPALAVELSNSEFVIVPENDVVPDDLYAGAVRVVVDGTLDGDLVAAAGEDVVVNGVVTGSVTVIAPTVTIEGAIDGTLKVVTNRLVVNGRVGGDIVGSAITASFGPSSMVSGDVVFWAWKCETLGTIHGSLEGGFRTLSLAGEIEGDVDVSVNRIRVVDPLQVGGDLGYRSDNEIVDIDRASVDGAVVAKTPLKPNLRVRALGVVGRFMAVLFLSIFSLLAAYSRPDLAEKAILRVGSTPVRHWLRGSAVVFAPLLFAGATFLLLSLAPPAAAFPLLAVLVPVFLALLGIAFAVSLVAGAPVVGWLGGVMFRRLEMYGAVLAGSAVVGVAWFLPWAGWLIPLAVLPIGLGAWIAAVKSQESVAG